MNSRAKTHAISLWFPKACAPSKSPCCFQPSKLAQCVFDFPLFPCSSAGDGSPPSGEGQWLDTDLQGKQRKLWLSQLARQLVCWQWPQYPHISWVSSSTPEIIYAMTFPGRITLPLGRPARGPWAGVTQTQGSKVMGNNPSFTFLKILVARVFALTPAPCSWTGISCSSMKKKKKKGHHCHPNSVTLYSAPEAKLLVDLPIYTSS